MKIKGLTSHLLALFTALFAVGCSNNELAENPDTPFIHEGDGVYMSVQVAMPNSPKTGGNGRSFTDDDNSSNNGVEEGLEKENTVNNLLIVLATEENEYIASGTVSSNRLTPDAKKQFYSAKTSVSKTELNTFYEGLENNNQQKQDIRVFIFCNPTDDLLSIKDHKENWTALIHKIRDSKNASVWKDNNFLMANRDVATRSIPATLEGWSAYDENTPFKLSGENNLGTTINNGGAERGAIRVERSVARFDFKDGSKGGNNTYPVVIDKDDENKVLVNMKLGKMALVNMNNSFYYLRRVSDNGMNDNAEICGPEKPWYADANGTPLGEPGNYVTDVYDTQKKEIIQENFSNYFHYPLFNEKGVIDNTDASDDRWDTYLIDDVISENQENDHPEWEGTPTYGHYKIWRYVTENTIPAPSENQVNSQSTGIVFKGKMIATGEATNNTDENIKNIATAINNTVTTGRGSDTDPIIYYFDGYLYYTWEQIRKAADDEFAKTQTITGLVKAVYGTEAKAENGKIKEDANSANALWNKWKPNGVNDNTPNDQYKAAFKQAATSAKITLYQSSYDEELGGWGYYCYYYYWNRHNDNGVNGVMGPMEFAVVRNNVYKLAVTKINRLGHPRISENDPDDPKPDTPDEKGDVYLTVSVEVLPWVVRINNIEF